MKQKGYSLLELILVVLLMSVIGSSIEMSNIYIQEIKFNALVAEVERGIKEVQRRAVATGKQYNVYCTQEKIYLRQGWSPVIGQIILGDAVSIPIEDSNGKEMTGREIKFNGSSAPSKGGTIVLRHKGLKKQASITVGIATGKTTVYFKAI